jgi:hypothetical protein
MNGAISTKATTTGKAFCELLAGMAARFRVRLHACALMNNHNHLLLEREFNLRRAVPWLSPCLNR